MDRLRWIGLGLLLLLGVACTAVQARNTHGSPDPTIESQAWWGDAQRGVVVDACFHGTSATPSVSIATCQAYALEPSMPRRLQYLEELTARTVTYSGGDGRYFLGGRSNLTVTPGGWTCVAGTHYCWLKSATPPVLPPGMVLLQRSDVVAGAITAPVILAPWRRTVPYTVAQGTTLTFGACPDAGPVHIFNADGVTTGLVKFVPPASCTVYAEWWGAQGDGTVADQKPYFQAASNALEFSGGTILGAGPAAHYVFTVGEWRITNSNITFDGQGALFTGSDAGTTRIHATDGGTQADSGETAQFIHNVHLKNYRVGSDSTFPTNQMRGGRLSGCVNCSIENVVVKSSRGTQFTIHRCQHCTLKKLTIEHGSTVAGNFCTLLLHSNDTTVEDWTCTGGAAGTGPCCEGALQVKGGSGNRIINAVARDMASPAGLNSAFFQRGDGPWGFSGTDPNTEPYPFLLGGQGQDCKMVNCYATADPRRASIGTQWTNITVRNVEPAKCMSLQEAWGDQITGFYGESCRLGIQFSQAAADPAAGERNFTLTNFVLRDIGLPAAFGDGLYGVHINGAGPDSVDGLDVATRNFHSIHVNNGVIERTAGAGLEVEYASGVQIQNVTVRNAVLRPDTLNFGMLAIGTTNLILSHNTILDVQATPTIMTGIRIAENNRLPTVIGNQVHCAECDFATFNYLRALPLGRVAHNSPAFCTARTTDATPDVTRCVMLTKEGDRFKIVTSCVAAEGTTHRAYYERTAIVEEIAGVVTVYPNTGTGDITIESDPAWDLDYSISGNELRPRLTGGVGQTVDWFCDVDMIPMIP